jgi:hypothetical protein
MSWTFDELKDKVARAYDVILLCEILEISEEDILDRFEDRFLNNIEVFEEEIDNET